jgi:ribose 1,5-bisphosphokinase PhnN
MIEHLVTRFEAARLDHHQRELRRREEAAIARLGEKALADGGGARSGRLASLSSDAAAIKRRLDAIPAEQGTSSATARERRAALVARLSQIHLTAGRLALAMPPTGAESEVLAIRAEMADASHESERLRGEGRRMADESWTRIHSWVAPRAPALGALALAWLIAHGYAVSHTKGILASFGLSATKRGSHLVSLPVDTALVHYVLPLVVAAVCAYVAQRLVRRVREAVDSVRARSLEASRVAAQARHAAKAEARETQAPRAAGRAR